MFLLFRRKYLVAHPTSMWANHICRLPDQRCSYEVIPQGHHCKLYFDLEFSKLTNPTSDGEEMVETLIAVVSWAFKEFFKISVVKSDVLILDASTSIKFSQHLIYPSTEFAFQDNSHIGNFVKHLMLLVKERCVPGIEEKRLENLFVKNEKSESVSFCDLSVYSKNRNFRLFLSSKFGKKVPLTIAQTNEISPKNYICDDWPSVDAAFFSLSLITYFKAPEIIKQILTFSGSGEKQNTINTATSLTSESTLDPTLNGYNVSPWCEIDQFITELVAPAGRIRQWIFYEKTQTVVYHIVGTRYCASIGREHKSNHIKYVVNIPNGTYYQSCFDPDCGQSRPQSQPIPEKYLPWLNLLMDP